MGQLKEGSATTKREDYTRVFKEIALGIVAMQHWKKNKLGNWTNPIIKLMILVLIPCKTPSIHHTTTTSIHTFHSLITFLYKWFLVRTSLHIPATTSSNFSLSKYNFSSYILSKPNQIPPLIHNPSTFSHINSYAWHHQALKEEKGRSLWSNPLLMRRNLEPFTMHYNLGGWLIKKSYTS